MNQVTDEYSSETKDLEPCLYLSLRKANRVMSQIYDHYMADCGIKGSQFSILRATYLLKTTTNKALQEILVLDQTTLSRNLKPLIRDNLIVSRFGQDRRFKELALSKEGLDLYKKAAQRWQAAQREIKEKLGADNTALIHSLSDIVVSLKG